MSRTPKERNSLDQIRFSRDMRLWQVIARGAGVMVILLAFVLLGDAVAIAGPWAPLPFFLAALLLLANVLGYVELATNSPRAGGAYVQVHGFRDGWLSFLTGWTLILCGLGMCALLAQGFAAQVTTLLQDHLGLASPAWLWAAGLVILLTVNNTLGTQQGRQGLGMLFVMIVLLGFTLAAALGIQLPHYATAPRNWGQAIPLLFVSFIGLEVTATLQGEMRERKINAPRALLLAPAVAAALGATIVAVAVGSVGPETLADSRIPLALLGANMDQGAGRPFILIVGALALALAFNNVLVLIVRQVYVMSQDGYWPSALRRIHPRFKTPAQLIALIALLLLPLILLPSAFLSQLTGLLYLLVLMSVNVTLLRRQQAMSSPFKLPFHPWVPGLTLAVDVLAVLLWERTHLIGAAGCLGLGALLYLTYARSHHIEAKEGVTVFKPPPEERAEVGYRVLVPIANPATASALLRLAGVLARQRGGEVLALQVTVVPDQVPLEEGRRRAETSRALLARAAIQATEEDFAIQTITRVAHSVAQGILDTAREEKVDLILLGWRGYSRSFGASMGPVIDTVIREAPCDVTVAKGGDWAGAGKILVPTAGGPHAPIAVQLAMLLSETYGSQVTVLYVQLGRATHEQMEMNRQRLAGTLDGLVFSRPPQQKVIVAESVVEGIIRESAGYDLVLLGASEEGLFDQFVFGSIPQQIAARVPKTAVIVKRYGGPTKLWIRKLIRRLVHIFPRLNVEEQLELREAMSSSSHPGANYFVLIVLSSVIATLGLLLNSAAIVIGAMLVAPLMSPILAFSLGMVLGDVRLIRLSIEAVFKGTILAVIIAVFAGVLLPFQQLTDEILVRTQPTLLELAVALASGTAGAYALARKDVSAALPGVAIAAALMPPLGVAGLGLAFGNAQIAGGAFLLFLTNIASISLAGVIVFILLGIRPQTWQPGAERRLRRGLIGFALLLLTIAIPLGVIMGGIIRDTAVQRSIQEVLNEVTIAQGMDLVTFEYHTEDDGLTIVATVRSVQPVDQASVDTTAQALREELDRPVTLEVIALPVTRSREQ